MIRPHKHKILRIEASSACQLRCPSCPTATKNILLNIGTGFLRIRDFRKLLDENSGIKKIELSNYGEMFLNPDLLELMKYAHKKEVILTANNGVNLNNVNKEVLEGLVKYGFHSMTCSIDGASRETYMEYRVGGNYDAVINNIEIINNLKEKYRTKHPILTWQFILFGHNESELLEAKRMADKLNMNFVPKLSWDSKLSPWTRDIAKNVFGVTSREDYKKKHGVDYMQGICRQLWDSPQINWDGKVLGCCRNFWGDFGGNVFDDGLIDALNNEKMNYAKGMLAGINRERYDIPCTSCDIYIAMKTNSKWLDRSVRRKLLQKWNRLIRRFSGRP